MVNRWCSKCKSLNDVHSKICKKCNSPLGAKYRVVVSNKGNRQTRLVDSLTLAREIDAAMKTDMLRDEFDITHHRVKKSFTLDDVWEKYLPDIKISKKSWITDHYIYESRLKAWFGQKKLENITETMIKDFIKMLRKTTNRNGKPYTPASIKHFLVLLSRLYTIAKTDDRFKYQGENPVKKDMIPKLDNEIIQSLDEYQLKKLFDVLDIWPCAQSSAFIKILIFTGFRRGELYKLKWNDIDFDKNFVTLRSPKNNKTTTIPINKNAVDVFKSLPRTSDFVFPGRGGNERGHFKGAWLRIRKAAGIPDDFRLHDLRHNFASALVSEGVPILTVSKLLNHRDVSTTRRYAHLSDEALREAADKAGTLLKSD